MCRHYQNRLFADKANLFSPAQSGEKRVLLSVIICAACANFPGAKNARIRTFLPPRRKDAKFGKKDSLSFRPKGEIFLRSLAFARDDGPRPVTLASFAFFARETSFSCLLVVGKIQICLASFWLSMDRSRRCRRKVRKSWAKGES